jgi:hypothetical protein
MRQGIAKMLSEASLPLVYTTFGLDNVLGTDFDG